MGSFGKLTAKARLVTQPEVFAWATGLGTTSALALQTFGYFKGLITRNGAALGI